MNISSGDSPLKDLTASEDIDVLQLSGCGKGLDDIACASQINDRTVANICLLECADVIAANWGVVTK